MAVPTLITPRLNLRAFAEDDTDAFHRILSGRGVLRYFPKTDPPPRDRVANMIRASLKHWQEHEYGLWAVESRATGELMGRCGLQLIPETGEVEVDVILGDAFWGRGFATEACRASLKYGAETLSPERIVGIVHPDNQASRHLIEKLGLELVERTRYFGMDCDRYVIEGPALQRHYGGATRPA